MVKLGSCWKARGVRAAVAESEELHGAGGQGLLPSGCGTD